MAAELVHILTLSGMIAVAERLGPVRTASRELIGTDYDRLGGLATRPPPVPVRSRKQGRTASAAGSRDSPDPGPDDVRTRRNRPLRRREQNDVAVGLANNCHRRAPG